MRILFILSVLFVLADTVYSQTPLRVRALEAREYLQIGSTNPADAGAIRLENNASILWESSPAGTDYGLSLNTSERFSFTNSVFAPAFYLSEVSNVYWGSGVGSPEGVVTAGVGSLYSRTDGGMGTALYRKETGTGNTGWTAIPSGAGTGDALTANPLSQFAATTSAQLKGVLSDELGNASGKAIFAEGTLNIAAGKTFTASNTMTLTANDGSVLNIGAGGTLATGAFATISNYLPLTGGTMLGHIRFTDNTYDIGAAGATRPRTGYFGTSVIAPLGVFDGAQVAATADAISLRVRRFGAAQLTNPFEVQTEGGASLAWITPGGDFNGDNFTSRGQTYFINEDENVFWKAGNGSPEGVVLANIGSLWSRTDGSTDTTLYRKESGNGTNAGWVAVSTAGPGAGDVDSIGDVLSGAAFNGTAGTTLTFDNPGGDAILSYDGSDFTFDKPLLLGTGGVRVSSDGDGTFSLLGLGDGTNHVLNINLDDEATRIAISSNGANDVYLSDLSFTVEDVGGNYTRLQPNTFVTNTAGWVTPASWGLPQVDGGTGTLAADTVANVFTQTQTLGAAGGNTGVLSFKGTTSGTVNLSVADVAGTWTLKLPPDAGTSGYVMTTNGSGVATWAQVDSLFSGSYQPASPNLDALDTGAADFHLTLEEGYTVEGPAIAPLPAITGLNMDLAQYGETYSAAANETLAFSGTPATGQIYLLNIAADSTTRTTTIPSAFSINAGANITSVVTPADSNTFLTFRREAARWVVFGDPVLTTGTGNYVLANSPTITTPTIAGAIAYPDGVRQTFNPDGTLAGLNVGSVAGDPVTLANGDIWYDSIADELTAYINGSAVALGAGGGAFDATAVDAVTWSDGANASNVWTFDLSGTDPAITFASGAVNVSTGALQVGGVAVPTISSTNTLTNKRITQRVETLTDATPLVLASDAFDGGKVTTLSQATQIGNPSGTPTEFQRYTLRIESASAQTLTFDTQFRFSTDMPAPTATSGGGLTDYLVFMWNATDTKWDCVGKNFGF